MRRLPVLVATLLFSSPMIAGAQPMPKLDSNKDGVIDYAELQVVRPAVTPAEFNAIDQNSDGQLSHEEMIASHREERMKRLDANGDGAISLDELQAQRPFPDAAIFKEHDSDGDGKLSSEEFDAMHATVMARMGPPGKAGKRHWGEAERPVEESEQ